MKAYKKLISSVLTFVMILSLFTTSVFASVAPDVKNTEYEKHAAILGALGIMIGDGNGNFRPNDDITRAEVAKIAVTLLGLGNENSNSPSKFPDVAEDYWGKSYITTAANHGLVIGDDKGNFRPNDKIGYNEVITILVRALGYESQASSKGGYPTGYTATAASIGLTRGVNGSATLITRGNVAVAAYNALGIKMMEQTGYGSNTKFEVTDKTILKDKLNTSIVTGKVNAVGSAVLDGSSSLSNYQIRINNQNYNVKKADTRKILGFNAEAYIDNKTKEVIAIVPADGQNAALDISADNIHSIENSGSSKAINYWKGASDLSKTSKAVIDNNAIVMYNGKKADFTKFTKIESGYISLLDSDTNGRYDIVYVNETVNYVVDEVYKNTQKITDKYSNPALTLDFDNSKKTVILEKGNSYIGLDDLNEWDVISFTISEDKAIIFGNVTSNRINGKITEISGEKVVIDGKRYSVAKNYPTAFAINDEGTFYIDYDGKIAAFNGEKKNTSNYAYLEQAIVTSGISKVLKLEVFTSDGRLEILEAADKISVNSSRNLTAQGALSAIGGPGKLITFEKNSEGKVTEIMTANTSEQINEDVFTLNMQEDNVIYRESSSKLTGADMSVAVGDDTVIFEIPQGAKKGDYSVRGKDSLADGGIYSVKVYDVTTDMKAGAVVITASSVDADESSDIALVQKISYAKNSKGENIHRLYALMGGNEVVLDSKDESTFKKSASALLKEGDIIQLRKNTSGAVDKIKVLFDTDIENAEAKTDISDKLTTVYGKVTKKFDDSINVQIGSGKVQNYEITDVRIYVYDSTISRNQTRIGDLTDIESYANDGGRVFMKIYKDRTEEIVVIK